MHPDNPYTAPLSNLTDRASGTGTVSALTLEYLSRTKTWARVVSIFTFIASAFMVLAGVFMIIGGGAAASMGEGMEGMGGGMMAGLGIFYILLSFIYIYPGIKLFRYASRISDLQASQSTVDLERALAEQMGFWRFVGILMIVGIVLWVVFFGLAVALGAAGAMAR